MSKVLKEQIRSSAQGNCSAKSLAASVMSSILPCSSIHPCPACLLLVMLSIGGYPAMGGLPLAGGPMGERGSHRGRGGPIGGRGQGTFQSSCHVLHYHMVLRPKGTSHNKHF